MTYLELINKVLVGLREDTALGISDHLSRLIGQFVNEAKEEIEDSGPWYALRTTVTGATVANTATVDFTASTNERSYVLYDMANAVPQVWCTTTGQPIRLQEITPQEMEHYYKSYTTVPTGTPYAFSVTTANDGITMKLWPTPDAAYTITAQFVVPQAELTATTDVLTISAAPVWKLALAKAMDERGSEFSGGPGVAFGKADKALSDYKLRDFLRDPMTVVCE